MTHRILLFAAILLAPYSTLFATDESAENQVSAAFDSEGRSVKVTAPGLDSFSFGFAAKVEVGGTRPLVTSFSGTPRPTTRSEESTPYGMASVTESVVHFEEEQLDLMLRVGEVPGVPGILLQAGIRNNGNEVAKLSSVTPIMATAALPPDEWTEEEGRVYLLPSYAQHADQDWGKCELNQAVSKKPLSIAGKTYTRGLGTHAQSELLFPIGGAFDRFHATVGPDDAGGGVIEFEVWADDTKVFASGMIRRGVPAKEVDVSVAGAASLRLVVAAGPAGIGGAHANWVDAYLTPAGAAAHAETAFPASGITVEGNPADWLVTRFVGNFEKSELEAVCALDSLETQLDIREVGGFYRRDGLGFLFGPVGEPIAYLKSRIAYAGKGRASIEVVSDMSGVQVDPGETRWGQQTILLMERPNPARAWQTEWVAKTHNARTDKGALSGWCSWYLKTHRITGEDIQGLVDAVKESPDRLRPAAIQIDDGYQEVDGVWDANEKFSEGMPFYASRIAETGARPGLWMAITMIGRSAPWLDDPANMEVVWGQRFSPPGSGARPEETGWIDPTHPRGKARVADRVRHAVTNGFRYLKLDFNNIGGGGWYEKKRTSFEIMRDHYTNIREAAGEDTYILFCTTEPIRAVVGLVDASRISSDVFRGGIHGGIPQILRSFELNNRWYAVDADCYYLAPDVEGAKVSGGWPLVQTYVSMMGLSCGAAFTSDLWQWDGFRPHWRMTEILTPPARERTEVLDLGTSEEWPRLVSKVQRPWGDWHVALLWNPDKEEQSITLDFATAGLDPTHRYAVWSFWDNQYLGTAKGEWVTPALAHGASQHLCLTDLDAQPDRPSVIGSNLHIFNGAAEFKNVEATDSSIRIELTDAGAREGDLFVYSRKPLKAGTSSGCTVTSIEPAGEQVWKVHLEDRANGQPQNLVLQVGK